ncbi:MAG TPA: hypothetical protein VNS55_02930 [Nocardioides sp.]|nr:hypothetical protein [Nocardioides sp.]
MALLTRRRRIKAPAVDPATGERISPWSFVGLVLMAASFFLYAASGLVAPWWAVTVLLLLWVAQLVLCLSWFARRPTWVPLVGLFSIALWFLVLVAGGALLGWSA